MIAGKCISKPVAMRFVESPVKGTQAVEVAFEVVDEGRKLFPIWTGWLTKAAIERTEEALSILGYNGSRETDSNGKFTDPKVLNWAGEVTIQIEIEQYVNKKGETVEKPVVAFVNSTSGGGFAGVAPEKVKSSEGMQLLIAQRLSKGQGLKNHAPQAAAPQVDNSEPMPF